MQGCFARETVLFVGFELPCCIEEGFYLFIFLLIFLWFGVILLFYVVCIIASLSHHSLNGSLPSNVEIKNNTLFFKGPVTYDVAGTYVCDATNGIGTRTGIVDVNITGRCTMLVIAALSLQ